MRLLPERNSTSGQLILRAAGVVERIEPSGRALARLLAHSPQPPVVVTCVYRLRHGPVVQALLSSLPQQAHVALWALDEVHPSLADVTVGHGPGARLQLHERMLASTQAPADAYWIITDDDVRARAGALGDLAKVAALAHLQVCAPTHGYRSNYSHRFTLKHPMSLARTTHFVEVGPVVVLSPRARRELLPFPSTSMAGWGFEAYWSSVVRPGLTCALVDAISVEHLTPMGGSYDAGAEYQRGLAFAASLGVEDIHRLKTVTGTWRPWRSVPPWVPPTPR